MNERMDAKQTILIVDDSEMNRSLLADMLGEKFAILEAENGMEAAAILRTREAEISLMLLDIVMPVMDGFELLAVMNKNGWIKGTPVIMISAETVPAYVDRAYDLGVLDYISRPFDERTVQRRVMSTIMLSAKQKELTFMVADQMFEKEKNNSLMIEILSNIVEFRNGESGLHVLHIHALTEWLLKQLLKRTSRYPIARADIGMICNASALHDIGKIAVPESILNKPGKLTTEEFTVMKTHSVEGAEMLRRIPLRQNEPLIKVGYQICRWHHERYDGRGYPDGLKGDEIPIAAQVVSLADVYDALTSKRVYKPAFPHDKAIRMIRDGECGAFNPLLLECLMDIQEMIERELKLNSPGFSAQRDIQLMAEQMIESGELSASQRTIHLLEHERIKYQFFAAMSQEVQFEYTVTPEMLVLSEWGAKRLNTPEIIVNPREDRFGREVFRPEDYNDLMTRLASTTPDNPVIEGRYLLTVDGKARWSKVIARSMWSDSHEAQYTGAIGKIVDVHEDYEKLNRLERLATHDMLTGLYNRSAARSQIEDILRRGGEYCLLLFDLDFFKTANDEHGHLFGDAILKLVARNVEKTIRGTDIAARVGGDEFLIFAECAGAPEPLVNRIFSSLTDQYKGFSISVSMGVAKAPEHAGDYAALFHCADQALYAAKRAGKGRCCYYDDSMKDLLSALSSIDSEA